ncbi:hypothetical protein LINPERPRIM_LOCUS38446 [Linum perenne]
MVITEERGRGLLTPEIGGGVRGRRQWFWWVRSDVNYQELKDTSGGGICWGFQEVVSGHRRSEVSPAVSGSTGEEGGLKQPSWKVEGPFVQFHKLV